MKRIFLLLVLASATLNLFAQSDFFYSKDGKKETFKIRKDIVIFKTKSKDKAIKTLQHPKFKSVETIHETLMKAKVDPNDFDVNKLAEIKEFDDAYYMLEYVDDGALQILCNQIFVKPHKDESIEKIIQKSGLSDKIEKQELFLPESGIYMLTLACKMKDILLVSRRIYETGMIDFAEPVFYKEALLGNTLWQNQWNMKNTGQGNGTPGIDINVEPAWSITRGNSSTKIAIIDDGADLTHPDLQANLLTGLNVTGSGVAGSYTGNDAHGTSCAGVIGAINNNIGVVGVASGCKMIPIRAFINGGAYSTDCITALEQARLLGAGVISNSWGSQGSASPTMAAVINDCDNLGRSGKGCVVVACSHNDGGAVRSPANLPNVIAVGSVTHTGIRVSSSNYGSGLDVVAPVDEGVYTTDLQGASGENTASGTAGDYRPNFNGTSAACPQVAGIAGLVLSANSNLYASEVRNIISMTAKKLTGYEFTTTSAHPNGSWNNEVGYGLVDAHAAVQAATCSSSLSNQTVSSNKFVRSCSSSFTLQNVAVTGAKLTVKADATSITGTLQATATGKFEFR